MIWPRWLARLRCRHAGHFTDGASTRCVVCGEPLTDRTPRAKGDS